MRRVEPDPDEPAQAVAGRGQPNDPRPLFASGLSRICEFNRENPSLQAS